MDAHNWAGSGPSIVSFNVAALPVSLGGIVEEFNVVPTVASGTIVADGLTVAGLMMVLAPNVGWAIAGQAVAGA